MGISAVSQVSSKKADIYMKGQIHTNNFLRAMLNKEVGLRKGKNTISHCYFHSVEGYDRIFFIADAAFNMYPDLKTKGDILANTVGLARSFGVIGGNLGGMNINESLVLEISMDGHSKDRTYPEYGIKGIGSRTKIGFIPKIFKSVTLLLERVIRIHIP